MDSGGTIRRCEALIAVGRYELAREQAKEALASGHDHEGELTALVAVCTGELEGVEAALPLYRRSVRLDPSLAHRAQLAHAQFTAGQSQEAKELFDQVLSERPDEVALLALYADGLMTSQQLEKDDEWLELARSLLERALELAPNSAELHFSMTRYQLFKKDWSAAERSVKAGLALEPDHPRGLKYLGGIRVAQRSPREESIEALRDAVQADPTDTMVANTLQGELVLRKVEAIREVRQIVEKYQWLFGVSYALLVIGSGVGLAGVLIQLLSFVVEDEPAFGIGLAIALIGFGAAAVGGAARVWWSRRIRAEGLPVLERGGIERQEQRSGSVILVAGLAGPALGAIVALVLYGVGLAVTAEETNDRTANSQPGQGESPGSGSTSTTIDSTLVEPTNDFGEAVTITLGESVFSPSSVQAPALITVTVDSLEPSTPAEVDEWNLSTDEAVDYFTLRYSAELVSRDSWSPATISLIGLGIQLVEVGGADNQMIHEAELFAGSQELCVPIEFDQANGRLTRCELWHVPRGVDVIVVYVASSLGSGGPEASWG